MYNSLIKLNILALLVFQTSSLCSQSLQQNPLSPLILTETRLSAKSSVFLQSEFSRMACSSLTCCWGAGGGGRFPAHSPPVACDTFLLSSSFEV